MNDRTTRYLLALIALALWGLLLRPAFTPVPTRAADATITTANSIVEINQATGDLYLVDTNRNVFRFDPVSLMLRSRAVYVPSTINNRGQVVPATFTNPALP